MFVTLNHPTHSIFSQQQNSFENLLAQQLIMHAVQTIVADLLLNMLLNQQANSGSYFPPYTPPKPNQFQYQHQPQFFNSTPRQAPNVEHSQPNEPKQAESSFIAQASSAVTGIRGIAAKFDPNGKTQKEQQVVADHLHAFQHAKNSNATENAYDQLKTSLNKLVRRLGLLVHPDKNPAPEATEAFKELNEHRDQFDNAWSAAN